MKQHLIVLTLTIWLIYPSKAQNNIPVDLHTGTAQISIPLASACPKTIDIIFRVKQLVN